MNAHAHPLALVYLETKSLKKVYFYLHTVLDLCINIKAQALVYLKTHNMHNIRLQKHTHWYICMNIPLNTAIHRYI